MKTIRHYCRCGSSFVASSGAKAAYKIFLTLHEDPECGPTTATKAAQARLGGKVK